jgi:hypothetical protein
MEWLWRISRRQITPREIVLVLGEMVITRMRISTRTRVTVPTVLTVQMESMYSIGLDVQAAGCILVGRMFQMDWAEVVYFMRRLDVLELMTMEPD